MTDDPYRRGINFLMHERHGKLWRPRTIPQVCGWLATRLLAHAFDKPLDAVAVDIIEEDRAYGRSIKRPSRGIAADGRGRPPSG